MHIIPQNSKRINQNKLTAALEMVRRGFHLIPLKPKSKVPYNDLIPFGKWSILRENKATPDMVKEWFDKDNKLNFGVITGVEIQEGKRLIAVDLDERPTAKQLNHTYTPIVETSRGYHLYYLTDNLPKPHKTSRGEIKTNGYVVAPPSIHPEGGRYEWVDCLSFVDLPLANFSIDSQAIISYLKGGTGVNKSTTSTTTGSTSKEHKETVEPTINIYSRFKGVKALSVSGDTEVNIKQYKDLIRSEEVVLEIVKRVFNIQVSRVGKAFKCPLHEEDNPSAALYRADSGDIGLKDFHRSANFYTLPELYFTYVTGEEKKLKSGSWIIWLIRLLRKAGIIELPRIAPPKPVSKLSGNQKKLYEGFIELLEVQQGYKADKEQIAPFSRSFAAYWTGLKRSSIGSAKRDLVNKGYIEKVKAGDRKKRKAGKWGLVRG
ncbi:bifunctional DNA primase/polymerase [Natroniella acetigena]|uniref:bifunctional DNA primase/polymerase n=1 Tax=Natroniella acetigena TaxID=52004 RepID=UPI00200A492B|nr:bifunctional DNA primase/polymerase [Natroniella acetigena]MCK8828148.1 bifunctional DNA primase/polymerase [Natroniella acetigena]